ncbi:ATPase [candidate division MSBL1 archaeon SCGC-AAA259A05]|uniref:ATPase n=1 Tax=candidate division MSBL1 archaeon SCGC-AAA259A05 TaxID=1698259 RepID=A0A133UBS1_9EURY|nr:ATPase [candidate division MSBL1 archaeon SCGC-AAA259A05]
MPRIAVVNRNKCQPKKCSTECKNFCPGVRIGDETITLDDEGKPIISEELCTGCGICVHKCPFNAIHIINLPEELENQCVHRYGPNGFALYGLPIPREGKVSGLIGRNGIGKTTALEILGRELRPNLGQEEPSTADELKEFFKGSELQAYFGRLDEVEISYKPQAIARLPSEVEGNVGPLLDEVDERGKTDQLVQDLDLEEVLDRELSSLSGGELQRLGVVATATKDSSLYYFDEPSSHLDVYQRLNVARTIRKLAEEGKAVIVVEHDLATLDYMCDYVHIVYGTPNAYGVVSEPRGVRVGINVYLEGYLREENVRFRSKPIRFKTRAPTSYQEREKPLFDFPHLTKSFDSFKLNVGGGDIFQGEIVGVVGPNATGKTTFAKLLAGVLKPTRGEVELNLEIAYKPQYPQTKFQGTVREYLMSRLSKFDQNLKIEVLEPLGIDEILESQIQSLSGGELQRTVIASCLGQSSDLYLFDEPSAYLDVEQRLRMARVLKRVVEGRNAAAFVIDHDVLAIDYLSDRLLVFTGDPGIEGNAKGPLEMRRGMNLFLQEVGVTFRRDPQTGRPRVNKPHSRLDEEQKERSEYYYTG